MAEEFKVLSEVEHVLKRAGVYIGSTSLQDYTSIINYKHTTLQIVPGLLKIIEEIIDNSTDEFIRTNGKFANKISVNIAGTINGTKITVTDNGRGIPVVAIGDSYQPVLAWTKARAGSNFSDDANRITAGTNGLGSMLTNCFSTEFIGTTSDSKNKIVVTCRDNCSDISYKVTPSKENGTSVSFIPELSRFNLMDLTDDHRTYIKDRLSNLAVCYPGITFKFNDETIQFRNLKTLASNFGEETVSLQTDNATYIFASSGLDEEFRHLSYVNGINIKNGGSHVDYIIELVINSLRPLIKKKWKIEVLPNQVKQHLLLASWITKFPNLKFDSQTKERITNSRAEVIAALDAFEKEADVIARKIVNTDSIITPMIEAILHKKELADAYAAKAAMKKVKKKRIVNHLAASSNKPEEKELYLAEGLSAIGGLLEVRNPVTQGGYALRGKVMNTYGMKNVDIVKNKELSEVLSVLGLELDSEDISELTYGKIIGLTDQDTDGNAIFCLLLQFFSRWPKLFSEGKIGRVISPLYIAKKKADVRWYYTKEEFEAESSLLSGYEISYNKGLGSLDITDYERMIKNPKIEMITLDDIGKLNMAFGDSAELRKDWMMNND